MQSTINLLREFFGNAVDARQVFDARMTHAAHTAEPLQQLRTFLGSDTGNVFQFATACANTCTPSAHSGDGEAMRFVANLRHEHQRGRIATEVDLGPAVGEHELLQADLAALALLDADDLREFDAQLLEHLARHRDLAAPAVDEHEIGQA